MFILDKNKDFYDYYSHVYGVDKTITLDRRGSTLLTNDTLLSGAILNRAFDKDLFWLLETGYKQYLFKFYNFKITDKKYPDMISSYPIIADYDFLLIKTFNESKHLFAKEISIVKAKIPYDYRIGYCYAYKHYKHKEPKYDNLTLQEVDYKEDTIISYPIIENTCLTKLLDAETIWRDLSTYISSQGNDKDITIVNSDKDKIINHGFDTVTSFRNPIK